MRIDLAKLALVALPIEPRSGVAKGEGQDVFLGIDIGTSGVKAVLVHGSGAVMAQETAPLAVSRPQPMWSEQSPDDWWAAVDAAVCALPADRRAAVQGIGLAGQMHGATLLEADDRPLRPAILWNDGRSFAQCRELEAAEPASEHEPDAWLELRLLADPRERVLQAHADPSATRAS